MGPRLKVVREAATGLNERLMDMSTGKIYTRLQIKKRIEQGRYPAYTYYYNSIGTLIIRSKPDSSPYYDLG